MKKLFFSLLAVSAMLFASCGEKHTVEAIVHDFMDNDMGLSDYKTIAVSDVDSAFHVSDSMLTVMHQQAVKSKLVKAGTKYTKPTQKLKMVSVEYSVGKDTLHNTFYLDDKLQGIVGVKKDVFNGK